jgi:hypothetical protein
MAERFVVYVAAPLEEPTPDARLRLADLLGLDSQKLDGLLRRLPAEVTKPVPEATAATVARRFQAAGLEASVRVAGAEAAVSVPTAIDEAAGPTRGGSGQQSGGHHDRAPATAESGLEADRDELFPPSAFAPGAGPKAPSKVLVVALVAVVAVFVVLWILLQTDGLRLSR